MDTACFIFYNQQVKLSLVCSSYTEVGSFKIYSANHKSQMMRVVPIQQRELQICFRIKLALSGSKYERFRVE